MPKFYVKSNLRTLKHLRRTLQWTLGILAGLYFCLILLLSFPTTQRYAGVLLGDALRKLWGWNIRIERVQVGLMTRVILDGVQLWDNNGKQILRVSRLAAKVDIFPILLENKVSISNAQLFGADARIYQESEGAKLNIQFLIDTFSSKNPDKKSNTSVHIGSILLRHVNAEWNQKWVPETPGRLNPSHIAVNDLALTAHIKLIDSDSINVDIRRLSFKEQSGLNLRKLTLRVEAGNSGLDVENLTLALRNSHISSNSIHADWGYFPSGYLHEWIETLRWSGTVQGEVTPSDFKFILPSLARIDDSIRLYLDANGERDNIHLSALRLVDRNSLINIDINADATQLSTNRNLALKVNRIYVASEAQKFVNIALGKEGTEISPILTNLCYVDLSGNASYQDGSWDAKSIIRCPYGEISINGNMDRDRALSLQLNTDGIELDKILYNNQKAVLGKVELSAELKGQIADDIRNSNLDFALDFPLLTVMNYPYLAVNLQGSVHNQIAQIEFKSNDPNATLEANAHIGGFSKSETPFIQTQFGIHNVCLDKLGLTQKYQDMILSGELSADIQGHNINDWVGEITLSNMAIQNSENPMRPVSMIIEQKYTDHDNRLLTIDSEPIQASVSGKYRLETIPRTFNEIASAYLPSIFPPERNSADAHDNVEFTISVRDTSLINRLAGIDLSIPQTASINGFINDDTKSIAFDGDIPLIHYGKEILTQTKFALSSTGQIVETNITTNRKMKHSDLNLSVKAVTTEDRLRATLNWNKNTPTTQSGEIDLTSTFHKDFNDQRIIQAWIAPSTINISDTLWQIHPSTIRVNNGVVDISGFRVSDASGRELRVNGTMSRSNNDTLHVNLNQINLGYIMDLVNFHSVDFDGNISGVAYAYGIFSNPKADGFLRVNNFSFNYGVLGNMDAHVQWGYKPMTLGVTSSIFDMDAQSQTSIQGDICFEKGKDGLDLMVHTQKFNMFFLNKFTHGIMDDVEGRASGWCRIYGPFNKIDLEGDMNIDEMHAQVPVLNTGFSLRNDSVRIRPGEFYLANARIYDQKYDSNSRSNEHQGTVTGWLKHDHFSRMTYNIDMDAHNMFVYNKPEYGENSFYAVVSASGKMTLSGGAGFLRVDMNGSPEEGCTFGYNISSPASLTESKFITYRSFSQKDSIPVVTDTPQASDTEKSISSDLFLNFSFMMNENCPIRLLMDKKTGDYIELKGNGRVMAQFHNKTGVKMYGTYRISDGVYKLSVSDLLRRDFKFQEDGTITFGGNPMMANLNLQASYSVYNVSLDDLGSANLGFHNTRVDCIMKLSGRPELPMINFDLDMPNASAEEKQMVNSIISTEEERNMQVIYLLGVGRFYSNSAKYNGNENQGTMAVNSILSSTLASQFNQLLSNAVGNTNWNFGANLKTGQLGWHDMDVSGLISGRMFNNRLLFNGNIGYRSTYYSQRNFIGDVDVQYLLTRNGSVAIKAYNKTNDRYFVQSSLTTQGIGIQLQKDFNRFSDLFRWTRRRH